MNLNCLLVTQDPRLKQTVAQVFAGIDLRLREDAVSALELIGRSHFDAFVLDCDGIERGAELIAGVRNSRGNRNSVMFAIVAGRTSFAEANESGSNFVLGKPVEPMRLEIYLRSAIRKMESEHRRYFRYQLALDAEVVRRDGKTIAAQILNVSDGGLALRLLDRAHLHGAVTIRFTTPGPKGKAITVSAAPCWSTEPIFGMQFVSMDEDSRTAYTTWLASMDLV